MKIQQLKVSGHVQTDRKKEGRERKIIQRLSKAEETSLLVLPLTHKSILKKYTEEQQIKYHKDSQSITTDTSLCHG